MRSRNASALVFAALLMHASAVAADDRPNILLLVAEDMSPRVGAFGDEIARTPSLDRLAEQGVRYANVFTAAGVCAPSRAALVMGANAVSFGAQHMRTSTRPAGGYTTVPPTHWKAFPELLRAAGYYTYTDDKLDYQFSGPLAGSGPTTLWDADGSGTSWRDRAAGQPFFGLVNFQVTHESGVFTPFGSWPHSAMHLLMQIGRRFYFGFDPEPVTDPASVVLPPYYPDTPTVRADLARHYDNIHAMDAQVGRLLDQLEADGLAASTIVIWTTDHGDGLPRAKRELHDSGLHVPWIVRWPDGQGPASAEPGSWEQQLVSFVDVAPTLLGLANAPVPDFMQGRDFVHETTPRRRFVFAARDRMDDVVDRQRAVRDGRYKYIRSWHPDQPGGHPNAFRDNLAMMRELRALYEAGELDANQRRWFEAPGEERLFDVRLDPFELNDLSQSPNHQPVLARMRKALDAWMLRIDDGGDVPEDVLVETFWPGGEQPVTAAPKLTFDAGRVVLTNSTPGASSEVRIDGGRWQLAGDDVAAPAGSLIEARSVRYGWLPSDITALRVP